MILASLLIGGTATAAFAHYVYEDAEVWNSTDGHCLKVRSEISHGNGGGYVKVSSHSYEKLLWMIDCASPWSRGPGYLAVRWNLLKWSGSSWALCKSVAWQYNQTTTNDFSSYKYYNTPCGSGYYGTQGYGKVYYNSNWKPSSTGGVMWSGSHYLPA